MKTRQPLHILSAATLLLAATACTQDELAGGNRLTEGKYPVVIQATGLQAAATPASRATVDGDWQEVITPVAVQVNGMVKEYTVTASDADGYKSATLSSSAPFYWTSRDPITVSAWWPYGTTMPKVVVKEDQSTRTGFEGSDYIASLDQTVQFDNPTLTFSHRTARVTVKLQPGTGITSVTGAKVSVIGLSTEGGNPASISTYDATGSDTHEALTAPQTVAAGTPFIQVELGGGTYRFTPQSDVVLAAGSRYTYTVSVTTKELVLTGCTIDDWADGGTNTGTAEMQSFD